MTMITMAVMAIGLWLVSLVTSGVAAWRSKRDFWPSLGLAGGALLASYIGYTRLQLTYKETVNSEVRWNLDSKPFFVFSLVVAGVAMVWVLWQGRRVLAARTGQLEQGS